MSIISKARKSLLLLRKDEGGNMAMTFALSVTMLAVLMGSAVDYSTLSGAHKQSQNVADSIALNAAIFVKNHDRLPLTNEEGYLDGQTYTAADMGYDFKGWVEGGADGVNVTISYDDHAKEATVTVTGATVPSFMQVTGKDRLPFTAQAVVSYMNVDEKFPASIALVLDNSGSMAWDAKMAEEDGSSPAGTGPRINGLRLALTNFQRRLKSRLGVEATGSRRTLRMGMIPYSNTIITAAQEDMKWGYVTDSKISLMTPLGSTNSNPPMKQAKDWMKDEKDFHNAEADRMSEDRRDPLKFVIFMTDGQNTSGNYELNPGTTGYWYRQYSGRWYYRRSASSGWTEGTLSLDTDRVTIDSCQKMIDDDVQIFTIGYALKVGEYNANNPSDPYQTKSVTEGMRSTAYSMLQACASKPENFIIANAVGELDKAMDQIQNAIVEELIRIKS